MSGEFITLSCPSCGGTLQVSNSIDQFACANCGREHIVRRGGGIVSLEQVMGGVKQGVDKTASELAVVRINKEIAELEKQRKFVISDHNPSHALVLGSLLILVIGASALIGGILSFIEAYTNPLASSSGNGSLIVIGLLSLVFAFVLMRLYNLGLKEKRAYDVKNLPPLDNAIKERQELLTKHKKILSSE